MVAVWKREGLSMATVRTYLSFLRAFGEWIQKRGLVQRAAFYGCAVDRSQLGSRKSLSSEGLDVEALLKTIREMDERIGVVAALMRAFGLRRNEALLFKPQSGVVPFEVTGLRPEREANFYLRAKAALGNDYVHVPVNTPLRICELPPWPTRGAWPWRVKPWSALTRR